MPTDTGTANRILGPEGHLVGSSICGHSAMDLVDSMALRGEGTIFFPQAYIYNETVKEREAD